MSLLHLLRKIVKKEFYFPYLLNDSCTFTVVIWRYKISGLVYVKVGLAQRTL